MAFFQRIKDVAFGAKMQGRIDCAIRSVESDVTRAELISRFSRCFYEDKNAPSPMEAAAIFSPREQLGYKVWTAESAGMMYLDMVISAAKQFAEYKGTSNDPTAQYLLAGLERALAHMYATHIGLPDGDGMKHHPINCEASRDKAEEDRQFLDCLDRVVSANSR